MQYWPHFVLLTVLSLSSISFAAPAGISGENAPDAWNRDSPFLIQERLFALSSNSGIISQQPWPVVDFGALRLLQPDTCWDQMNPADGEFDFTVLDSFLDADLAHKTSTLLILFRTPAWASSHPDNTDCIDGPGTCDPPNDLYPDGTGPNLHWKKFVTAVVNHSVSFGPGRIRAYEVWNEPYNSWEWTGTYAQMVRMAKDAYTIIKSIDPSASVNSPSFAWQTQKDRDWMNGYLAAGGGQYADHIDVHGYVFGKNGTFGWPENMATYAPPFFDVMKQNGQGNKPVWDTEANWGKDNPPKRQFDNPALQAAWVARAYLLHASYHVSRFYWFSWNNEGLGQLWRKDPNDPGGPGTLLPPGKAYQQVTAWTIGATLDQPCITTGTIWTCNFSRPGGYVAQAVWDTSQTCNWEKCSTTPYTVDPQFIKYSSLDGTDTPITGTTVPVGALPILLENQ